MIETAWLRIQPVFTLGQLFLYRLGVSIAGDEGADTEDAEDARAQAGRMLAATATHADLFGRARTTAPKSPPPADTRQPVQQWPLVVLPTGVAIGLGCCFCERSKLIVQRLHCMIIGASMAVSAVK